jgi:hypothetical protein
MICLNFYNDFFVKSCFSVLSNKLFLEPKEGLCDNSQANQVFARNFCYRSLCRIPLCMVLLKAPICPIVSESWQTWLCIIMILNRDQKGVWSVGSLRSQTSLDPGQFIHYQTLLLFPGLIDHIFVLLLQNNNARLLHDWTVKRDCAVTSNVSQLIELVSNRICHSGLCHDLLHFNWAFPTVWEFVFLQRHFFCLKGYQMLLGV